MSNKSFEDKLIEFIKEVPDTRIAGAIHHLAGKLIMLSNKLNYLEQVNSDLSVVLKIFEDRLDYLEEMHVKHHQKRLKKVVKKLKRKKPNARKRR